MNPLLTALTAAAWTASILAAPLYRPFSEDSPEPFPPPDQYGGVIVIKFYNGSEMAAAPGPLYFTGLPAAGSEADIESLRTALAGAGADQPAPTFSRPALLLRAEWEAAERQAGSAQPDLTQFYDIPVAAPPAAETLLADLRENPALETAFARTRPPPLPTPDLSTNQHYFGGAASNGYAVHAAWSKPGGRGSHARVIDIEYDWTFTHEDLNLKATNLLWGTLYTAYGPDHGNASAGISVALTNGFGINGIVPQARLDMVSSVSSGYWVIADAVNQAAARTAPGDILLIEQQLSNSAFGNYCPVESQADVFSAIANATALERIVIEPAGNGGLDLDHAGWSNLFQRAVRDSGAILVGAGACSNRSRCAFSCYGSRLDIQGWGDWSVATLGYGDLYGTAATNNYTRTFAGTSSASALSAAIAAALQSYARAVYGTHLPPLLLRACLLQSGLAQTFGPAGAIGPLPNLSNAIPIVDTAFQVQPFSNLTAQGPYSGPFAPTSQIYIVTNAGPGPATWTLAPGQAWVSAFPATVTVAPQTASQAVVSVNAAAGFLAPGAYADTVLFSNTASGAWHARRVSLTVTKGNQTIAFPHPGHQTVTSTVGLSATASSGLPVTFAVLQGPGKLVGPTDLVFQATGSVSVAAMQPGDPFWNPAPTVVHTIRVDKAHAQVSLQNLAQTYDGTPRVAAAVTVPPGLALTLTYDGVAAAPIDAGAYAVDAVVVDPIFQGTAHGTLVVAKAGQTIDFPPIPDAQVTDTVFLNAAASSGLPVSFAVRSGPASLSYHNTLAFSGPGRVSVSADQSGNRNWNAAAAIVRSFMVLAPERPVAGCDVDGDGLADPILYNEQTGTWSVKLSESAYRRLDLPGFLGGPGWAAAAADYDGDGLGDPAVYQESTGSWKVMPSGSAYALLALAAFLGSPGWVAACADYEGDRLADFVVYQEATGSWKARLSSAAYALSLHGGLLGGPGQSAVPADYDGDGQADPAVYRRDDGTWTLRLSGGGYAPLTLLSLLGGTGWVPAPADYDGDGLADPAVRQPATGTWMVMLSAGGYRRVTLPGFFGAP